MVDLPVGVGGWGQQVSPQPPGQWMTSFEHVAVQRGTTVFQTLNWFSSAVLNKQSRQD